MPEISKVDLPSAQPGVFWANMHRFVRMEERPGLLRRVTEIRRVSRTLTVQLPVARSRILLTAQYNQMKALRKQPWAAWEPLAETCRICHKPSRHWSRKSLRKYLKAEKTRTQQLQRELQMCSEFSTIWLEPEVLNKMFCLWKPPLLLHL